MQNNKTTIRFYAGVRNIGGPVMAVTHNKSRVVFDFGTAYDPAGNPFDGFVEARQKSALADAIRLKQVPAVDGLFAAEELGPLADTIIPAERADLDTAVLISHPHLDHMGNIDFIHPSIPVYMEEKALDLMRALYEVGEGIGKRPYSPCRYGEAFRVGEIQVTPYFSDHAVWGAAGFLVETPEGRIFWTGDVRFHGLQADRAFEHVRLVADAGVDFMIMEGSTLSLDYFQQPSSVLRTEAQYLGEIAAELRTNGKLSFFNLYHRDIQRMQSLIAIAEQNGRKIAFEPETAYVLEGVTGRRMPVYVPDFELFDDRENRPEWLTTVLDRSELVTQEQVKSNPAQWFVLNSYKYVLELMDFAEIGGVYIHLDGIPLGAFDPAFDNLHRILARANMKFWNGNLQPMFGHAIPEHLKQMVDTIDPAYLAVVHSRHPERLTAKSGVTLHVEAGDVYTLSAGHVTKEQ